MESQESKLLFTVEQLKSMLKEVLTKFNLVLEFWSDEFSVYRIWLKPHSYLLIKQTDKKEIYISYYEGELLPSKFVDICIDHKGRFSIDNGIIKFTKIEGKDIEEEFKKQVAKLLIDQMYFSLVKETATKYSSVEDVYNDLLAHTRNYKELKLKDNIIYINNDKKTNTYIIGIPEKEEIIWVNSQGSSSVFPFYKQHHHFFETNKYGEPVSVNKSRNFYKNLFRTLLHFCEKSKYFFISGNVQDPYLSKIFLRTSLIRDIVVEIQIRAICEQETLYAVSDANSEYAFPQFPIYLMDNAQIDLNDTFLVAFDIYYNNNKVESIYKDVWRKDFDSDKSFFGGEGGVMDTLRSIPSLLISEGLVDKNKVCYLEKDAFEEKAPDPIKFKEYADELMEKSL